MEIVRDIEGYQGEPCAVTVGLFDGVHVGHQHLLMRLKQESSIRGLKSVVVTLHPHPRVVLSKGNDRVGLLTTLEQRLKYIEALGIDRCIVLPFTREFSDLTAREFMREYLRERIGAKMLLLGYNHRFGSDTLEGEDYIRVGREEGIIVERGEQFVLGDGEKVSSSLIRNYLSEGSVERARELLGHPYMFAGRVCHGDAIGRELGYRTANLEVAESQMTPGDGVYAGLARAGGKVVRCVVNIGRRPTVGGPDHRVEAHLIDWEGELYDEEVWIMLTDRLRSERKFDDRERLREQIGHDIEVSLEKISLESEMKLKTWFEFC